MGTENGKGKDTIVCNEIKNSKIGERESREQRMLKKNF